MQVGLYIFYIYLTPQKRGKKRELYWGVKSTNMSYLSKYQYCNRSIEILLQVKVQE